MKKISLAEMDPKKKGRIVDILATGATAHKFMSMGIYKGREITKVGQIAFTGPVTIRVGRSVFALGHSMAKKIMVETE